MSSIWQDGAVRPRFGSFSGETKTDVLIIGGGLAGILCCYLLKQAGVACVLVEANRICSGVTGNTTAKITVQHGLIYDQMAQRFGLETVKGYLQAQFAALERYRDLCRTIPCDFEEQGSFVYSRSDPKKIEREAKLLETLGYPILVKEHLPLPFSVSGAIGFSRQAQFHPLKFAFALAKDLPIYENTKVLKITPRGAITNKGTIVSDQTIVATHFPILNRCGFYFFKQYQHRSYVLALNGAPSFGGMYVDEDMKGLSFRHHNGALLLGGGSHRTGKDGGGWKELEEVWHRYYPQAQLQARWATQDCMTLDHIPYIGRYSSHTPGLFVATGFNKWGMTSSMVSALILSDRILGKENSYAEIFSPNRSVLRPQLAVNLAESLLGYLSPTVPRCSHLGCALRYNRQEHSWDCPCHGSRFDLDGAVIENPAIGKIKIGL